MEHLATQATLVIVVTLVLVYQAIQVILDQALLVIQAILEQ